MCDSINDYAAESRRDVAVKQDSVIAALGEEVTASRRNKKGARVVQAFDTLQDLVIRRHLADDVNAVIDAYVEGFKV